jgi:hypothetical protein
MDITAPPPPPDIGTTGSGWRTVSLVSWLAILVSLIAVAMSSRTIGRSVWWLGPPTNTASPLFLAIPTALVVLPAMAWYRHHIRARDIDLICAFLIVVISVPDFPNRPGTAAAMLTVGIAALLQSIAVRVATRHYR